MDSLFTRRNFLTQSGKVALAAGLGGALLEACGGGSSSGTTTISLGWWSNSPTKDTAMKAWVHDFEKAHPTIKVNFELLPWTNYWSKLQTTTAGGNAYDVIGLSSGSAGVYFNEGALTDLSTFSDYKTASSVVMPDSLALGRWNGKTYSLPIGTSVSVLGYNKKLLRDAGVAYPDPVTPMTFEQFTAIAQKISRKQNGSYTQYAFVPTDIMDYDQSVRMFGGQTFDNPINPKKMLINSPAGIQGLTQYQGLFTNHIAPPYAELTNGPWSFDLGSLDTGKIGFARVGAWLFADMQKNPDYGVAPMFQGTNFVTVGAVNSLAVYKGSKNQQQAWEFLKWATQTSPEVSFAKFSDIPSNTQAFSQMNSYIEPVAFVPTLQSAFKSFQPNLISPKGDQIQTALGDVITDMMTGKLTPAQAAASMEQKGNALITSNS